MFDYTLDLITVAASNSLFIFFFCNLIIFLILVGSKPTSNFDQDSEIPLSMLTTAQSVTTNAKPLCSEGMASAHFSEELKSQELLKEPQDEEEEEEEEEDKEEDENEESTGIKEEEDDDLRRKVEEFIEKVNKGWMAEKLKTSQLL